MDANNSSQFVDLAKHARFNADFSETEDDKIGEWKKMRPAISALKQD